jgi:predicted DNA-binding ribbon-helix-helix protein
MSKDPTNHCESPPVGGPGAIRLPLESKAAATWDAATAAVTPHADPATLESNPGLEPDEAGDRAAASDPDVGTRAGNRGLPSRNIVVDRKRTSIRLDTYSLESLYEIAERERVSVNELCTLIHERNKGNSFTLTAAIRIFLLSYFRAAATEEGHRLANHGRDHPLAGTPFDPSPPAQAASGSESPTRRGAKAATPAGNGTGRQRRAVDRTRTDDAVAS